MTFFDRLKASCPEAWDRYVRHPFVERLGDGSLPPESFRHYLEQDYLFLIEFARVYALATYKAESLAEMRRAKEAMSGLLDVELDLHLRFCDKWGIAPEKIEQIVPETANKAYTDYVMACGLAEDMLALRCALMPCLMGYAEIGSRLKQAHAQDTPYLEWIDMYAGSDYQDMAAVEIEYLDGLADRSDGEGRFKALSKIFEKAVILEADFWQMGLDYKD